MRIRRWKRTCGGNVQWVLLGALLLGEALGALYGGAGTETASGDLMQYSGAGIGEMFCRAAGPPMLFFAAVFLASGSLGGIWMIPLAVFFRGLGIGAALSLNYGQGSLRCAADGVCLLLPYYAAGAVLLLAQSRSGMGTSMQLNRMVRGGAPANLLPFLVHNARIFTGLCLCALLYAAAVCARY